MTTDSLIPALPVVGTVVPLLREKTVEFRGKKLTVYGLSRVDPVSLQVLAEALEARAPQALAMELDAQRHEWLSDRKAWEALNLLDILRQKKGKLLGSYLALRMLQQRFGSFDQQQPGDEMCVAMEVARRKGWPVYLLDRDMKVTGLRAWRMTPFFQRNRLFVTMMTGPFRRTRSRQDAESPAARADRLARLRKNMPAAARAFLEERQAYMAQRLAACPHEDVAVVLSTLHFDALVARLEADLDGEDASEGSMMELEVVPKQARISRVLPWLFTAVLLGIFGSLVLSGDSQQVQEAVVAWVGINVGFTALFLAMAMAHPLTVLGASISAPFVSLNPAIGAGTVALMVEGVLRPPTIIDIERVGDDIIRWRGWWQNRLARLVLVLVLANAGSTVGTIVALSRFPSILD